MYTNINRLHGNLDELSVVAKSLMLCVAFDFAKHPDCTQLVCGSTHYTGGTLDLVFTDVPDLCRVIVGGTVGRSDHSCIGITLELSVWVPIFEFLK